MKKTKLIFVVLAFLFVTISLLNSCTTKPITQSYPERWEKTYIGMSLEEFKQIWPESKGPFQDANKNILYSFGDRASFASNVYVVYFAFQDNKLVSFNEI